MVPDGAAPLRVPAGMEEVDARGSEDVEGDVGRAHQPRPEGLVDHAQRDRPPRRVGQRQVARRHVALDVVGGQPGALALVGADRMPVAGDDGAVVELPPAQRRAHREPEPRDALGERVLGAHRLARRGVGRRAAAEDVGLGAQGAGVLRGLLDERQRRSVPDDVASPGSAPGQALAGDAALARPGARPDRCDGGRRALVGGRPAGRGQRRDGPVELPRQDPRGLGLGSEGRRLGRGVERHAARRREPSRSRAQWDGVHRDGPNGLGHGDRRWDFGRLVVEGHGRGLLLGGREIGPWPQEWESTATRLTLTCRDDAGRSGRERGTTRRSVGTRRRRCATPVLERTEPSSSRRRLGPGFAAPKGGTPLRRHHHRHAPLDRAARSARGRTRSGRPKRLPPGGVADADGGSPRPR